MTAPRPPRMPDTLFSRTLVLVVATVLLLTAVNLALIVLRPPPNDPPLTAHEIARLIRGQEIAKRADNVRHAEASAPPANGTTVGSDALMAHAIAHYLGVPAGDVRIASAGGERRGPVKRETQVAREFRLYRADGMFNPPQFGPFTAAARLPDGKWRIVARTARDPLARWQIATILGFLLSLAAVLPFAWIFSKRLARPIRAFASAAEEIGRRHEVRPVAIEGPAEIRQAGQAVRDMQARLQRYVTERTSVVGAIAHDLRTPLSRMAFHLAEAPEPVRSKAEGEIAEMERMITATLDFVQNEARPRSRETIDLGLLVEGVVDDLADLGRDVAMLRNASATMVGDPLLLKRLFANLINNAVAYGRRARVSLEVADGWAIVEIGDDGPGLSKADLARVFEPFYRAESSRNRATGGIGLGLAIVRTAAEAHGGTVTLENKAGGGLCARVRLRLR